MKLVEPEEFKDKAKLCGLDETKNLKIKMKSGKSFLEIIFKQNKVGA